MHCYPFAFAFNDLDTRTANYYKAERRMGAFAVGFRAPPVVILPFWQAQLDSIICRAARTTVISQVINPLGAHHYVQLASIRCTVDCISTMVGYQFFFLAIPPSLD